MEQNLNDTINGFYRVSNYSASLSLSTKLYGMYKPLFMKKKEIQIRHVVTPQVSISGAPSFSKYWEEYTDNNGNTNIILLLRGSLLEFLRVKVQGRLVSLWLII